MSLKQKLKTAGIGLALTAATNFAKATPKENNVQDKHINQTSISQDKEDELNKVYIFSTAEINQAMAKTNLSIEMANKFMDEYAKQINPKFEISVLGLITAMANAQIPNEEAFKMFNTLINEHQRTKENTNLTDNTKTKGQKQSTPQRAPSPKSESTPQKPLTGYNFGQYRLLYNIDNQGVLNYEMKSSNKALSEEDIKEVNEAICRHTGKAVDETGWQIKTSTLMTQFLVYRIVQEEQKSGNKVPNGDIFLKKFEETLKKNGLEIGKDRKLHGIEASKNKPLKTRAQLFEEYKQEQARKYKNYLDR